MNVYNDNNYYCYCSLSLGHHAATYLLAIASAAGQVSGVTPISQMSREMCENNQKNLGDAEPRAAMPLSCSSSLDLKPNPKSPTNFPTENTGNHGPVGDSGDNWGADPPPNPSNQETS